MTESPNKPGKQRRFTTQIIAALILGIAWGLFWGESGSWVKWIGDAFVGLLQMSVLPYVAVSLTFNVGRLSAGQGSKLARAVIIPLLLLWSIGILTLGVMALSFPAWKAGSFYSTSMLEEPTSPEWLDLFIPTNPFYSLTNSLVPAVVLFSLGLGIALIPVSRKESLLAQLEALVDGLTHLNRLVVRLSPIGIFGIVGHASGTMSLAQMGLLQGYLLVYGSAAALLSLWVLPALVACCTPFSQREVLRASRDALLTAFIIGNSFAVLPMIIEAIKRIMGRLSLDPDETSHSPEYLVPLAYPVPDIGRIVGLVFIPFAAWFYGMQIDPTIYPQLIGVGFVGAFAKPVVTVPLLLNLAEIPSDIFNLYVAVGIIASRFGDLMKAMHLIVFSLLAASLLVGAFRLHPRRLLTRGVATVVIAGASVLAIRMFLFYSFEESFNKDDLARSRQLQGDIVPATIVKQSTPNSSPLVDGRGRMNRIVEQGVIRIGIDTDELPFSYFNKDGQLVGFDIDMAHQLALELNVSIEFVPFVSNVEELLRDDHIDVAMSGLEGTVKRAMEFPHVQPYMDVTVALVVPDHRRHELRSLDRLRKTLPGQSRLRIAVIANSRAAEVLLEQVQTGGMWDIDLVELASERDFFESQPSVADVLITSAEVGSAWTLKHPEFSVVKPVDLDVRLPLYYLVADESRLEEFLEYWLELTRRNGTIDDFYNYWILGLDEQNQQPRWCIARNILGWID